jgi:hypothetical protein
MSVTSMSVTSMSVTRIQAPEKSWINLRRQGEPWYVFLAHDAIVNGYPCRGGGHDFSTTLYPGGELKTCWLAEDHTVDGVPCMRAGFFADAFGGGASLDFHANGSLENCRLSRDFTFRGHAFRAGGHIRLDATGKVHSF